jgi:hypothetical protein
MMKQCRNCGGYHATAAEVRECFSAPLPSRSATPVATIEGPTEKQQEFIRNLLDRVGRDESSLSKPIIQHSVPEASSLIDDLLLAEKEINEQKALNNVPPRTIGLGEDGMYRTPNGTIYKVQYAVHGSGNLYAKRLIPPSEFGGRAEFDYERGAVNKLRPEWRMTLEQAKEFGALYGTCCVCRTLTREESIEAGIGPICAGRF